MGRVAATGSAPYICRNPHTETAMATTAAHVSKLGFDLTPPDADEMARLTADLTPEEDHVLLNHGTERPFCGVFNGTKEPGTYVCRICALPLFRAGTKFESGTGWPSFFAPVDREHVKVVRDVSFGMVREEIRCQRCDGHMGHVFNDGPPPTGLRFCMNSVSLELVPEGEDLPNRLGREEPARV
jgi:peptide-methionine (R)-S-oxide reductase